MGTTTRESVGRPPIIRRLDEAVDAADPKVVCQNVKRVLMEEIQSGGMALEDRFLESIPDSYARRLLHKDPAGRYSVVVMVWGAGQGTPLHDHAGQWCVECVYQGRIRIVSYDLERSEGERHLFHAEREILAGHGEAGSLIPPFEYHTIENHGGDTAVTIHVYSSELTWSNVFRPAEDGTWRKERRELEYTP